MKCKTIIVESAPTARGENKSIAVRIDQAVDAFLDANPRADIKNVAITGEVHVNSFNRVLLVLLYEGEDGKPAAAKPKAEAKPAAPKPAAAKPK